MSNEFPLWDPELTDLAEAILEDYESITDPFQPQHLPEKKVIDDVGDERDRTLFLTFVAAVDYQKETAGENGLWQVMKRLWDEVHWPFEPAEVVEIHQYQELVDLLEQRPIMAWRDPHIWFRNALTLHRRFDDDPRQLFERHDWSAIDTLSSMRETGRDFPYLKGDKISSLWLRLIHEEVHPLTDIEEVEIPVDSRIRELTKRLVHFEESTDDLSDGDLRKRWGEISQEIGTYPVRLDQPLWLIEKNWEDWGRLYVLDKLEEGLAE